MGHDLWGVIAGLGCVWRTSGKWRTLKRVGGLGQGLFGGSLVLGLGVRLVLGLPRGLGQTLKPGLGTVLSKELEPGLGQVLVNGLGLGQ